MASTGFNRVTAVGQLQLSKTSSRSGESKRVMKPHRINMEDVPPNILKAAANPTPATPQHNQEYPADYSYWDPHGWGYGTSADLHKSMPKDPQALPDIDLSAIDMELNPDES